MSNQKWNVKSSEALDMTFFINAISNDEFYNIHYYDVRSRWLNILSNDEYIRVIKIREILSISSLCTVYNAFKMNTIEDIIQFLSLVDKNVPTIDNIANVNRVINLTDIICNNRQILLEGFQIILKHEIHFLWRQKIKPQIDIVAEEYMSILNKLYPLHSLQLLVSHFLGESPLSDNYSIYMCTYIKPIAVQLSKSSMAIHQGSPGYMPLLSSFLNIFVHESIHGFQGSQDAQAEQDIILEKNILFKNKYTELLEKWKSGSEENFVTGAEAYLTEVLGLRSYEQCINYLRSQNGGMRFAEEIYLKLREEKPDKQSTWKGYGYWLVNALKNNEITYG
ncbi:hypothetical protein ACFP56_05065 [Paenibacillus septentrionalis]|uniref:DUF4932 domain-containing protein n=1 Tax=Paenibacillus septentrionalis TaxID=429342 RepID=A0ABW1V3S3_9BACL